MASPRKERKFVVGLAHDFFSLWCHDPSGEFREPKVRVTYRVEVMAKSRADAIKAASRKAMLDNGIVVRHSRTSARFQPG